MFDDKPWFAPKRFGYGSGAPIAWQGWIVIALHVLLVVGVTLPLVRFRPDIYHGHGMALFLIEMGIIVLPLPVYAAKTRGGWKWRWGEDA
jgi:hypothetical protein